MKKKKNRRKKSVIPTHTETQKLSDGVKIKDIILGGQDGIVNTLGLVLGVAAATQDVRIVIISGLAGTFAESISMAAVAFTSSNAAQDFYKSKLAEEKREIRDIPEIEKEEIRRIYRKKGFSGKELSLIVKRITSKRKVWVETMMTEELHLFPEEYSHPMIDAFIVGGSSLAGSFIPLIPFFFLPIGTGVTTALILCTLTLFITGALKARYTIGDWKRSGIEMAVIGMLSAIVGYAIGRLLGVTV